MHARRFNFQFAALPIEILQDHDAGKLRDVDLVIVSKLIGRFRTWLIHEHDDVLATLCGVAESTLKECLRRLRALGRIRSVKATVRGFRRALAMVWLAPSEAELQPLLRETEEPASEATVTAPEGPPLRPEAEVPPDPPIEEPERRTDDDDSPGVAPDASPVESSSPPSDEPRKATPAEVEAVVTKAKKLFPDAWLIGQQVKRQAKLCVPFGGGLSWVAMALNEAEAARAHSFGHVVRTLGIWREQGYPSPRQSKPVSSPSIAASLVEKQRQEHLAEIAEAAKPAPPPTAEEIATWLEWVAAGPRQPLYKFALGSLMKAGVPIPTGATQ